MVEMIGVGAWNSTLIVLVLLNSVFQLDVGDSGVPEL